MGGHSCVATWELITGVDMTSPCMLTSRGLYLFLFDFPAENIQKMLQNPFY